MEEDENKWVRGEWGRAGRKTIHQTFRACPDKVIARLKKEKKKKKKKRKQKKKKIEMTQNAQNRKHQATDLTAL